MNLTKEKNALLANWTRVVRGNKEVKKFFWGMGWWVEERLSTPKFSSVSVGEMVTMRAKGRSMLLRDLTGFMRTDE